MFKLLLHDPPISVNTAYPIRAGGRGKYLSNAGKVYKELVGYKANEIWEGEPTSELLRMAIWYSWKDKRVRDVHNYHKVLIDALEGIVYASDSQIIDLHVIKQDLGLNRTLLKIWKINKKL